MKFKLVEKLKLYEADGEEGIKIDDVVVDKDAADTSSSSTFDTSKAGIMVDKTAPNSDERITEVDNYIKYTYSENDLKRLDKTLAEYKLSLIQKGVKNNFIDEYVKNFIAKTDVDLDPSYLEVIQKLPEKELKALGNDLYDARLYNEKPEDNIFRLKSLVFINNPRNIKSFKLYKDNDPSTPLTSKDILGKSTAEVRLLLNEYQSEEDTNRPILSNIFRIKELRKKDQIIDFLVSLYNDKTKEEKEELKSQLNKILENTKNLEDLKDLEIANWQEGKDDLIQPIFNEWLNSILNNNDADSKVNPILDNVLKERTNGKKDSQKAYLLKLFSTLKDEIAKATVEDKITYIFNNDELYKKLLALNLPNYIPNNDNSLKRDIITGFLNNVSMANISKATPNLKSSIIKQIQGWTGNEQALKYLGDKREWKPYVEDSFKKVYKPGMTFEDTKKAIVKDLTGRDI